jgi:hypothetical protein
MPAGCGSIYEINDAWKRASDILALQSLEIEDEPAEITLRRDS